MCIAVLLYEVKIPAVGLETETFYTIIPVCAYRGLVVLRLL